MNPRRFLLAFCLLGITSAGASAQVPAEKATSTFKLSPGLEATLWASELSPGEKTDEKGLKEKPRFMVNPTCMDVDHRGRVWIPESVNYRMKLRGQKTMRRPEGDRILVLEDTTGSGAADKVHVFYQSPEIHAPLGIAVAPYASGRGQRVYVCQSPNIWVFEDKDGDLKADGPPTVLLTGFQGLDHDHGVHGIIVGPDNKLYFTVGDSGVRNLKASDGKGPVFNSNGTDCRAATVWRCDLNGKNLELIAHNFRNNYEPCVDSFGTVYLSDNDDDGNQQTRICYVMPGGDYGYHRNPKTSHWNEEHPGIVPKILRTYFGSPTGIATYEGDLIPNFKGSLLHTDAGPRHVRAYHLTPSGAAYSVKREDFVESTDNWFRPSDVAVAPDGSIFVADWYDPGVGGHGMGDVLKGRIFRIAPKGNTKQIVPPLDLESREGVIRALASPNLATRAAAMATIQDARLKYMGAVANAALPKNPDRILRARATWMAEIVKISLPLSNAFKDPDPDFRVLAMRISKDFDRRPFAIMAAETRRKILDDPSPAVRREALLQLQYTPAEKAAPLIYELARRFDGKDRFYLAAIGIAVGHHDQKRRETIFATIEKEFPSFDDKVAAILWELRPPQAGKMLESRLADAKIPAKDRSRIVDILADSNDPKVGEPENPLAAEDPSQEIRERASDVVLANLKGRWSGLKGAKELSDVVDRLWADPKTTITALALVQQARLEASLPKVASLVNDGKASEALRIAGVRALGGLHSKDAEAHLSKLVDDASAGSLLRQEAVNALAGENAGKLRAIVVDAGKYPVEVRQAAVAGLASTKQGAEFLLEGYASKKLAGDLTSDLSRLLRNSPMKAIKDRANQSLPAPPRLDPKKLPSIAALLTRKGNANKGSVVMERSLKTDLACLKCHTVNGQGGNTGPELSAIGSKASRENLLESILYPSKAINHQYQTWQVETKEGLTVIGIVAEETPTHLVLRDAAQKEHRVALTSIESRRQLPQSIMPDNLLLYMSEEELADLVEYMSTLKSRVLTTTGN